MADLGILQDASAEYYLQQEMSKLTDTEEDYAQADDDWEIYNKKKTGNFSETSQSTPSKIS